MEMLTIISISALWILFTHSVAATLDRRIDPALVRVNPIANRQRLSRRLQVPNGD